MTCKKFILNYDMRQLVKSSQEFKEYMESDEIKDLQKKVDDRLEEIERDWYAFLKVYKELDTNKKEFEFNYEKTKKVDDSLEDTIKKLNEVFEKNVQKTIIQNDIVENKIISNDDFFEFR